MPLVCNITDNELLSVIFILISYKTTDMQQFILELPKRFQKTFAAEATESVQHVCEGVNMKVGHP